VHRPWRYSRPCEHQQVHTQLSSSARGGCGRAPAWRSFQYRRGRLSDSSLRQRRCAFGAELVHKLITGLLDQGRIAEQSTGSTADNSSFDIVMTSNPERKLASLAQIVPDPDECRLAVKDALQGVFKPEQLARLDIQCFATLHRRASHR